MMHTNNKGWENRLQFDLDYNHYANVCFPDQCISVLMAQNEFEFLHLKDRANCYGDIMTQKVYPKQMIAYPNYCPLQAWGVNKNSGKVSYWLFAYNMVSNRDDLPKLVKFTW